MCCYWSFGSVAGPAYHIHTHLIAIVRVVVYSCRLDDLAKDSALEIAIQIQLERDAARVSPELTPGRIGTY